MAIHTSCNVSNDVDVVVLEEGALVVPRALRIPQAWKHNGRGRAMSSTDLRT